MILKRIYSFLNNAPKLEKARRSPDHFRFFHTTFLKQFLCNSYPCSKIEILKNPFFLDRGSGLDLKILRFLQNKNSMLRSISLKTFKFLNSLCLLKNTIYLKIFSDFYPHYNINKKKFSNLDKNFKELTTNPN